MGCQFDVTYWLACSAMFAYVFGQLAPLGIQVLGQSQMIGFSNITDPDGASQSTHAFTHAAVVVEGPVGAVHGWPCRPPAGGRVAEHVHGRLDGRLAQPQVRLSCKARQAGARMWIHQCSDGCHACGACAGTGL